MRLVWRMPAPSIMTQWRGPDAQVIAAAIANPQTPIAAIIGPPGSTGAAGPAGPAYDMSAAVIDAGTYN